MPTETLRFKQPIRILQVFSNINVYGKDKKSFEDRKTDTEWKAVISKSGSVKDGELSLPVGVLQQPHFKNCGLITLEDSFKPVPGNSTNQCFYLHHSNQLYIFDLKLEEELVLFLKYGYFEVGIPKRENFKLCELKQNEPVEIKINGKTDASMASGRQREFKEQFYIFNYLGLFSECKVLREPFAPNVKEIPQERKEVYLLKTLW